MEETTIVAKSNLPGDLILLGGLASLVSRMETVDKEKFRSVAGIPDWIDPCQAEYVVALRAKDGSTYWVLDNWDKVALDKGPDEISCLVFEVETDEQIYPILAKLSIRLAPSTGLA